MWFTQYMLEELHGAIYIIWLSESGNYYQSTLAPHTDFEQNVLIS